MLAPRGPLPLRRLTAHWVVIAAAALTTLVAAAVAAALAAFAGQALPQAARHDLVAASGTAITANGSYAGSQVSTTTSALRTSVAAALPGVPFSFWQGIWSNPLGLVSGAAPARPAGHSTPVVEAAALDGVQAHATLVSGRWPGAPGAAGAPVQAALPANAAARLGLHAGETIRLRDRSSNAVVAFTITGLFAQRQLSGPAAAYWQLDSVPASGLSTEGGFTTFGPLVVAQSAFSLQLSAASVAPGHLLVGTGTWVAQPDMARFGDAGLSAAADRVSAIGPAAATSEALSSVQISTQLPTVLTGTASNLTVARSLLAISALQLVMLALAALVAVARLLAAQREGETALLTARGGTRGQLTRLTAAEVVPLALVSAVLGGAAGVWLARLLGRTLGGSGYQGVSAAAAGTWLDALAAAAVITVLAVAALLFPVLRPPSAPAAGVRRGRQAAIAGATRAGTDVALLALAVLAGWQLRRYSAVATTNAGTPSLDPVLTLAPALALAGGTVLTLRLLPAAARLTDRLAARGRGLTGALAGWQFSRQPLRQGGAALLLVLAVAAGTLALAQHASWARSAADQSAFTAGGDVRADLAVPLAPGAETQLAGVPGVRSAMAAATDDQAQPGPLLAIDSARAGSVVRFRPDQSAQPVSALYAAIAPAAGTGGQPLPGQPRAAQLTVTLSRAPIGAVTALFTVTEADGDAFQLPATAGIAADGRPHVLSAPLGGAKVAYPLRITQVTLTFTEPAKQLGSTITLTVAGATATSWAAAGSSADLDSQANGKYADPRADGWVSAPGGAALTLDTGFGQVGNYNGPGDAQGQVTLTAAGAAPALVPAVATRAFVNANQSPVGSTVSETVNGITVPVRIAAVANTFPTVGGDGALVVNLRTLESYLVSKGTTPLGVTEWWLATDDGQVPAALGRALPADTTLTSRTGLAAATRADPLSAAPQQALLAMALAAMLLAITGFWVSIAADVRQRRAESALLAALGVTQRAAAARLFLEKLLLSVPAAALGLVLGLLVARLLVPAVTLTAAAQTPVPPPVTLFDLSQTAPLALAVAIVPALAAALVVFRRPDPAAELRAAEAA